MKQIYDFEAENPPVLNENMLRNKIEKCKLQRQTAVLALSGILMEMVVLLLGLVSWKEYPVLGIICFVYVIVSATGAAIMSVIFSRKEGMLL